MFVLCAATLFLCALLTLLEKRSKIAVAQNCDAALDSRSSKSVEKLFMTICEKNFSAQESHRSCLQRERAIASYLCILANLLNLNAKLEIVFRSCVLKPHHYK
jgi:hypothetical protein